MADITELLDKERFRKWLRGHNPAANVGESGTNDHCPLAMYLQCNGVPSAEVGPYGERIVFDDKRLRSPRWVQKFVTAIDALPDDKGQVRDHVKVRAYRAWDVLEGL